MTDWEFFVQSFRVWAKAMVYVVPAAGLLFFLVCLVRRYRNPDK